MGRSGRTILSMMERVNSRLAVAALSLLLLVTAVVPVKSFGLSSSFGFGACQPQLAFSRNLHSRGDHAATTSITATSLTFSTGSKVHQSSPESSAIHSGYNGHYDFRLRFKVDEELMKEFGDLEESNSDDKKDDDEFDDDDDIENESELVEYMATVMVNRLLGMKVLPRRHQQHKEKASTEAASAAGAAAEQKEEATAKQKEEKEPVVDKAAEVPAAEDSDEDTQKEVHELLHKKEGDRNVALKDEFLDEPELKEEKETKAETTAEKAETTSASTITTDSPPLPSQISLAFGRPLTVIQSNLPAVNLTAVVQPKQTEKPAAAASEKPVETTSKVTTIVPEPSEQTQTERANDVVNEKENDEGVNDSESTLDEQKDEEEEEETVIATKAPIIPPPPPSASSSDSTNEKKEDDTDEKEPESTTAVEAIKSPVITPPPPPPPSLEKKENAPQPPRPVVEKKEEESSNSETVNVQTASSSAATKSPIITPPAPPKDASSTNDDDDEAAKKLKLEETASKILFDLGLAEKHQDPADPSYDHSHDDETAPENRYKTSEKRP